MDKKYKLIWGGHDGGWFSRDLGDPYHCDTKEECLKELDGIKVFLKRLGRKLWFAEIKGPDGERVFYENGESYR